MVLDLRVHSTSWSASLAANRQCDAGPFSNSSAEGFRHTLIDDLRDAGVQDSVIKRIAGHEDGSVTFSVYGSRSPVRAMADALDCIHPFFGIT